jgi:hypothetical protein
MDSTEFLSHPIFSYTGKEKEFQELNNNSNAKEDSKIALSEKNEKESEKNLTGG